MARRTKRISTMGMHAAIAALLSAAVPAFGDGPGPARSERPFDPSRVVQREFGIAGDPGNVTMSIPMVMLDTLRFQPDQVKVKLGANVRLMVRNNGQAMHEVVLGTMEELRRHAEMMRQHPEMKHDEPHMAHVEPGKTEWIVWTFNRRGEFYYGCLVPGHFEAGMLGKIVVE